MRHCTKSYQRANDRATRRRNIGSHTGPHAQHRQQLQPKSYSAAHFVWIFAPCHFKYGFQADTQSANLLL